MLVLLISWHGALDVVHHRCVLSKSLFECLKISLFNCMIKKSFFVCLLLLSVCGCNSSTRVGAGNNNEVSVTEYQNSITDLDCVNLKSCSLLDEYVNALGQNCKTVETQSNDLIKYCKSPKSDYWEQIKVL